MAEITDAAEHRLQQLKHAVDKANDPALGAVVAKTDAEQAMQAAETAAEEAEAGEGLGSPKPNTAVRLAPLAAAPMGARRATASGVCLLCSMMCLLVYFMNRLV
jgi:hypothetical protein